MNHGGDIYTNQVSLDFSVNTNALGMPARVQVALNQAVGSAENYPDQECRALRSAIAARYSVLPQQVLCGNGASELLMAAALAVKPGRALITAPGFAGYRHALNAVSCEVSEHTLYERDGFRVTERILDDLTDDLDLLILACPNNPTGMAIDPDLFVRILETCEERNVRVIADFCFFELMDAGVLEQWSDRKLGFPELIGRFPSLVILNAFTKTYALAGVRIGFALSQDQAFLSEMKNHQAEWSVSVFAQAAGIAAALELTHPLNAIRQNRVEKAYLAEEIGSLKTGGVQAVRVFPSDGNYLLLYTEAPLYQALLKEGILIRDCGDYSGLTDGFYRIAVKNHSQNEKLVEAIRKILGAENAEKKAADEGRKNLCEREIKIEHVLPADIEANSMETILQELSLMGISLDEEKSPVIRRCIHTAADFEYASTLCFSDDAINIIKNLIRAGADIVTDTNMALSGINKAELAKYGGEAHCFMADADVAAEAKARGVTRATVSMEKASKIEKPVIFAIGNAPTALIELDRMMNENRYTPAFVIGVPVGFVNVVAAKELIMRDGVPYIVNRGRKGGSNVAAAICNAILYELRKEV